MKPQNQPKKRPVRVRKGATKAPSAGLKKDSVVSKAQIKPSSKASAGGRALRVGAPSFVPQGQRAAPSISVCALAYAAARTDPHSLLGKPNLPCIPDGASQPSFKFSARTRFEFVIGTAGAGGVACWPWRHAANNQISVPTFPASYVAMSAARTTAAYASTGAQFGAVPFIDTAAPPVGVVPVFTSNSLFRAVDLGNDLAAPIGGMGTRGLRLVGSAIRIGYTGAVTDQKGTLTLIRNPNATANVTVDSDDLSELLDNNTAVRLNVRDMMAENANGVSYAPILLTDTSYVTPPFSATNILPGTPQLNEQAAVNRLGYLALITGGTPGSVFTVDYLSFFEATGTQLPLTASEADPLGFMSVSSAHASTVPSADPRTSMREVLRLAAKSVLNGSGALLRHAGTEILRGYMTASGLSV